MKIILLAFVCLIITSSQAQHLKLTVNSLKSSYLKGEPVEIIIGIKNNGEEPTGGNFYGKMKLKLFYEHVKELEYAGPSGDSFSPIGEELNPNEEIYNIIEVNRYFGKLFNHAYYDHYLETGNYTLQVFFFPTDQKSTSVQTKFRIDNPKGNELIVYNTFWDIIDGEAKGEYSAIEVAEKLRKLHNAYPNSVYSTNMLTLLDAVYDISLGMHKEAAEIRIELVENYPSVKAWWALDALLQKKESNSDKINYIKKLQSKSKGTSMESMYQQKIKSVEKKQRLENN